MRGTGIAHRLAALLLGASLLAPALAVAPDEREAVRATLTAQAEAWNRGDIDGFMRSYWNDPKLRFASGDNVTYGWQPTLDRYRAHYPDRSAMGTLRFADLDIELLGDDAAQVFGRWALAREHDAPHGVFTLLLRKTGNGWKITSDHTSAAP